MRTYMDFKSGFIAILGRPNVGKSTLLNALTQQKVAITSAKPQTTRNKIIGICHDSNAQYIFVDTPGINQYKHLLNQKMNNIVFQSIKDVDLILFLTDSFYHPKEEDLLKIIFQTKKTVFLVINKIDSLKSKSQIDAIILSYLNHFSFQTVIPLSAIKAKNTTFLKENIYQNIKPGVAYYPKDMITDQKKELWIAEMIREKVLYYVHEEIPHASAVIIEKMEQKEHLLEIWGLILVERSSQKQILIGKAGSKLKQIGTHVRQDLNCHLQIKTHINLWVKVYPNWRNQKDLLSRFGY
ncbi:GTP-binding protein Era [Candidatus Phytoplasma asteris]|uniref:GTPase Era n=2 Tax=Candidatus Phytoplasma asteris TaxID=85620 RepID=A0ABZ2YEG9_9MOLU